MHTYKLGRRGALALRAAVKSAAVKRAADVTPAGYQGLALQQYMPVHPRRTEFTPLEQELIRRNLGNVFPKVFKTLADSPAVDLASPIWTGMGTGAALGGATAGIGAALGSRGGTLAGIPVALLGALFGAKARIASNQDILESMRRIPADGTRRDLLSDPVRMQQAIMAHAERLARQQAKKSALMPRRAGATKSAASPIPGGYQGLAFQRYMPTYSRRDELTPEEQKLVAKNRKNVIPKIFTSAADSPAVDLASPAWSAVGGAGVGALVGGISGANMAGWRYAGRGAAIGSVLGAGILGAIAAKYRHARNQGVLEYMHRIPPDGRRRDLYSDPVYYQKNVMNPMLAAIVGRLPSRY